MLTTMPRKAPLTQMFLRVKQLREDHRLTQRELAQLSGIAEGTIKAWESGRVQDLTLDAVRRLAPVYGMTPEALMLYLTEKPAAPAPEPKLIEGETIVGLGVLDREVTDYGFKVRERTPADDVLRAKSIAALEAAMLELKRVRDEIAGARSAEDDS